MIKYLMINLIADILELLLRLKGKRIKPSQKNMIYYDGQPQISFSNKMYILINYSL